MNQRLLITICARGGSKGIPGKNVKLLNNKPLIYYTLRAAFEYSKRIKNSVIIVSTDSNDILSVIKELNFDTVDIGYIRPNELASDTSGKLDVIIDVKNYAEEKYQCTFDLVLDLDVTSPLRTIEDLVNAHQKINHSQKALNLFSVSPSNRNPYFNMVEETENGFCQLVKKGHFLSRQTTPKVYDLNASFYFYKKEFFEQVEPKVINDKSLYFEVSHTCFDLDHAIDFEFMSFLVANEKLDFNFIQ